jgi:hypothetical protein
MRSDFRFTKEQISTLIIEHGLDLSVIPSRPLVKSDPEAPLVKELLKRKNDFIINKMVFSNIKETHDECIKTINEIDSKWKPKSASSFVWQFSQENDLNEIEMKAALAEIHPMLADRYPFHKASTRVRTKRKLASHIDLLRYPKNRQYFFEKLTGKVLSDEERSVLFVAMLAGNAHSVHEVIKSDFFSSKKEYFWLSPVMTEEILEALEKTSLDMRSFDAHGKSLLFYQVNSRDTDLLDYLYENDYPFYPNSLGEDPLHKVLKQAYHKNYIHRSLAKIDALMRYEPKIDRFHLQYMALVKLKYIDTYHQIIEKHPGLTVNDDTPLPEFTELK